MEFMKCLQASGMNNYVVATTKSWNIDAFYENCHGGWCLITEQEVLTLECLRRLRPRYVFFPHWSWVVPPEILAEFECVCFHLTDVPFGRGGSPLQNLITSGYKTTKLTALKMTNELDAGPVYGKLDVDLTGKAERIYDQVAELCYAHIRHIIANEPIPAEQEGEVTYFKRRKPAESVLPYRFHQCYDHIRMLDAPDYPKAFIERGDLRLEFTDAVETKDGIEAKVVITNV